MMCTPKTLLLTLLALLLFTACNSGKSFTSRKYTGGRYVSHAAKKHRVNHEGSVRSEAGGVKQENLAVAKKSPAGPANELPAASKQELQGRPAPREHFRAAVKKQEIKLENTHALKTLERIFTPPKNYPAAPAASQPGKKSLNSVLFSGIGFIMDITGFIMAVTLLEYAFIMLIAVGLTLGIFGMIFGFQGIREYRVERNNGNKDNRILVLGIVGASVGLAAIIVAIYLAIYAALIIALSGL